MLKFETVNINKYLTFWFSAKCFKTGKGKKEYKL